MSSSTFERLVRGAVLAALAVSAPPLAPPCAARELRSDGLSYRVALWTIADGLPQGTVNDILQTPDGELWLATFGGLLRFDGVEFRSFDLDTLPGLPSSRFTALCGDGGDGLWALTQSSELLHFVDRELRENVRVESVPGSVSLTRARDGALWLRSKTGALVRVADGRPTAVDAPSEGAVYRGLACTAAGALAVACGSEVGLFDVDGRELARLPSPKVVRSLTATPDGELWLGLVPGLARMRGGTIEELLVEPPIDEAVTSIAPDSGRGLWLGTDSGVRHVAPGGGDGPWSQSAPPEGMPSRFGVRSLARDREGNLWVGSFGQGLARLAPLRVQRLGARIRAASVLALVGDGAGGAWIALDLQGLFRLDAGTGEFSAQALTNTHGGRLVPRALLRARDGQLWLADDDRVRCGRDGRFDYLAEGQVAWQIVAFAQVTDGSVFAAGEGGRLVRFAPDGRRLDARDLPGSVVSLHPALDGSLWIGGSDCLMHLVGGRLETYGNEAGVPKGDVRDMLFDEDGSAWIATYGGGLARFAGGRATRLSTAQGLPDASLTRILDDGRGRLWILSNRGLIVAERSELLALAAGRVKRMHPVVLGPEAGMSEGNFGSPAGFRDEAGRLWFGTVDGVVRLDPQDFPFNRTPPTPRIQRMLADDVALEGAGPLDVPAGTRRLTFEYTAFALTAPERAQFRYRLDGFDEEWNDGGTRRRASFTAVAPGEYAFRVEARNEDGVWSARPAELRIRMLPSWWQTAWFRAAAVLAAAGALLTLHRVRVAAIRRRAQVLLALSEARARAEERESRMREELAHVARVATAGELATSLAHEVNQPLGAIVNNALAGRRLLAREGLERAELEAILADIAQQGQRAAEVIRRLREFLRKHTTERRSLELNRVLRETLPLVRRELEEQRVRCVLELAEGLPPVTADPVQLQQVVVNLVKNACEALSGNEGVRRVELRTRAEGALVVLEVADTGPGIAAEIAARLFQPYVSTKPAGMGLGLAICRTIVEAHGGRMSAARAPGGGALFRVELPARAEESTSS